MARIDVRDLALQIAALDASIGREAASLVRHSRPFSCLKTHVSLLVQIAEKSI